MKYTLTNINPYNLRQNFIDKVLSENRIPQAFSTNYDWVLLQGIKEFKFGTILLSICKEQGTPLIRFQTSRGIVLLPGVYYKVCKDLEVASLEACIAAWLTPPTDFWNWKIEFAKRNVDFCPDLTYGLAYKSESIKAFLAASENLYHLQNLNSDNDQLRFLAMQQGLLKVQAYKEILKNQ